MADPHAQVRAAATPHAHGQDVRRRRAEQRELPVGVTNHVADLRDATAVQAVVQAVQPALVFHLAEDGARCLVFLLLLHRLKVVAGLPDFRMALWIGWARFQNEMV